jgi:predicted  nucleic acid-binding Zn ribbon protein
MQQKKQHVDKVSIYRSNSCGKEMIESALIRAENIHSDNDKKNRLDKCLCKSCYYIFDRRMGGASITRRPCGICEKTMQFSNTATDVICPSCAKQNDMCKQCGGDIELKNRRSPKPFMAK